LLKALGWFLFLAFDAAIVVWFVHRQPEVAPAPAVSVAVPTSQPSPLAAADMAIAQAGFNAFSFQYANEIARTDGTRNMVFSPLTTYVQLLFLERAANHRLGKPDSSDAARSAQALDELLKDAAFSFSSDFTLSHDIGIDEWTRTELTRNKIAYWVDPAKLAVIPSRFGEERLERERIHGLWTSRFRLKCTWIVDGNTSAKEAPFQPLSGDSGARWYTSFVGPAKSNSASGGAPVFLEVPFNEGYSLLAIMPEKWDPRQAISALQSVITGDEVFGWDKTEVTIPVFWYKCDGHIDLLLENLGYLRSFEDCIPLLGPLLRNVDHRVKVDAMAKILCYRQGVMLEAETKTEVIYDCIIEAKKSVVLDRPFLYAIRHNATGIIVGLGWVVDPVIEKPK